MKHLLLTLALFAGVAFAGECKVTCMTYEYPDGEKGYVWMDLGALGSCPESHTCKSPTYETYGDFCSQYQAGEKVQGVCVPHPH